MSQRLRRLRWARAAAIAALLVALYAALGFWALPALVEHQLPRFVAAELGRQASVARARFNPFTLRLEADQLLLAEANGDPLFAARQLVVQPQWRSLLRRTWTFSEVRLAQPQVHLTVARDGRFNLAELIATVARRWPPDPAADDTLPRVSIGWFGVEGGSVQFEDLQAGYRNALAPIDFTLTQFSTLPGQTDTLSFIGRSPEGGIVRWKGEASVNPIRGSGELALEKVSLPELAVYLKPYTLARIAAGRLSTTLPYRFSYEGGQWQAGLAGARLAVHELAIAREGAREHFASLTQLELKEIAVDLATRQASVGEMRGGGGKLAVLRDAQGHLDLGSLVLAATTGTAAPADAAVPAQRWNFAVRRLLLDDIQLAAIDQTVQPPLQLTAGKLKLQLGLAAELGGPQLQLKFADASASASDLSLSHGGAVPLTLSELGFDGGQVDITARKAEFASLHARGGSLQGVRDPQGRINLVDMLPRAGAAVDPAPADTPWTALVRRVELGGWTARLQDQGSGVALQVSEAAATLEGASTDPAQALRFDARVKLDNGSELAAQGSVVPQTGALQADVRAAQVALAPFEPLLRQAVRLKLAQGQLSAEGRLTAGPGGTQAPALRYQGSLQVGGLLLKEDDGDVFAAWKSVRADRLSASLSPNLVDIPDLRVSGLNAKLIIEDDRSLNASRLLVKAAPPPAAPTALPVAAAASAAPEFKLRVRRLRLQDATLDFTDLSLRPQFAAKIQELQGVVTGLSTDPAARTQVELDGRVDEYGTMRARGDLNVLAPTANTDLNVVFRNVDMVPASPYSSKFAGYKVAEGRISLDLQYKLRDRKLQGDNQIVIEHLTLGERVESPDALRLPLQLAIAILKDKDGRIELGLPVSGDLSDPEFSYGALIWKAIGALITKIVTAPFRALGAMLGLSGEQLEAIQFDPGSDRLPPHEREKLQHVAGVLAKKPQLVLSVPAGYAEAADTAALQARAVRLEVARRSGITLDPGEEAPPVDLGDGEARRAVRELYVARFGQDGFEQQKRAAESAPPASASGGDGAKSAKDLVPLWRRVGQVLQGEPQVPDAAAFYGGLLQRLNETQPLPADALTLLAGRRAQAVLAALAQAGVDATRMSAGAPDKLQAEAKGPVALKLALDAR